MSRSVSTNPLRRCARVAIFARVWLALAPCLPGLAEGAWLGGQFGLGGLVGFVGFVGLSACTLGPGPMPVRKILVDVEPPIAGVDREQVRAVVESALKGIRGFRVVDGARGEAAVMRVRVERYGVEAAGGASPRSVLSLSVEFSDIPGDEAPDGFRGHAVASGVGKVEARALVDQALREALAQVLLTRGASDLSSDQLSGWLEDQNASAEQKRRAVRVLGSRRERSAVPAISRVLLAGDPELQALALAALSNIGDGGGVDAVVEFAEGQPALLRKQCIDAVRAMGGTRRGRAWLFTLSTGHPDTDVQQAAAAALAALEAGAPPLAENAVAENATRATPSEVIR